MKRLISNLHRTWAYETVYVLASGASMCFLHPNVFRSQIVRPLLTIGVNDVWRDYRCNIVVTHHPECVQTAIDAGQIVVTSEYAHGDLKPHNRHEYRGDYYEYQTYQTNRTGKVDLRPIVNDEFDKLVISYNTVAEAINLAWLMGASSIILCGVDGGYLDGELNYPGYNNNQHTREEDIISTYHILVDVVNAVRAKGCAIGSYNPFLDLNLEGHEYRSLVSPVKVSV